MAIDLNYNSMVMATVAVIKRVDLNEVYFHCFRHSLNVALIKAVGVPC
jgi:hypothetical protein